MKKFVVRSDTRREIDLKIVRSFFFFTLKAGSYSILVPITGVENEKKKKNTELFFNYKTLLCYQGKTKNTFGRKEKVEKYDTTKKKIVSPSHFDEYIIKLFHA